MKENGDYKRKNVVKERGKVKVFITSLFTWLCRKRMDFSLHGSLHQSKSHQPVFTPNYFRI